MLLNIALKELEFIKSKNEEELYTFLKSKSDDMFSDGETYDSQKDVKDLFEELLMEFITVYPTKTASQFEILWQKGVNPLMLAVQIGSIVHVQEFLNKKTIDVNAQDAEGKTALMYCNDAEIAELLIKHGAKGGITDEFGRTALFYIYDLPTIQYLVTRAIVDVHHCDKYGQNVLFFCKQKEVMSFFISQKVDVHAIDRNGRTPLFEHGVHEDLTSLLLEAGAKANHKDKNGRTALFECRDSGAFLKLVKAGGDATIIDDYKRSLKEHMQHITPFSPLASELHNDMDKLIEEGTILA